MSKIRVVLAIVACAISAFTLVEAEIATPEILTKQKTVYDLLYHVEQPEFNTDLYNLGKDYDIEANIGSYKRQDYVHEFIALFKRGMLPRGEIFSIFYPEHLKQAVAFIRVLYHSKDFEIMKKTAAWGRIYLNENLYIYAFYVAVSHSPDTQRVRIPAHSELYPHLYFPNTVIRKAYLAKTYPSARFEWTGNTIILSTNDTQYPSKVENKLKYFTDDIAANDVQYYSHINHPFWMSTEEYGLLSPIRGEVYCWNVKLQYERHNMELYSNGLEEVLNIDWNYPIPVGYFPDTSYHNGLPLPNREPNSYIPNNKFERLEKIRTYEDRIARVLDTRHVILPNGTSFPIDGRTGLTILGNLIEGNADSVNFELYGSYDRVARDILGFNPEPLDDYEVFPSTLQNYGVDQRDPIYWSLMKKITGFCEGYAKKLPKYTPEELSFSGVRIVSLDFDRITTFFKTVDYPIGNAVHLRSGDDATVINARNSQLTHKSFTYTITVESDKVVTASIRIFIGYKRNFPHQKISMTKDWNKFIIRNEWTTELKVGNNTFERNSINDLNGIPEDEERGDVFYEKIQKALKDGSTYDIPEHLHGYPLRLTIPKGTAEGTPFVFFAFVSPIYGEMYHSKSRMFGDKVLLDKSLGWPLDRPPMDNFIDLPNAFLKTVNIYHKEVESKINLTI